MQAKTTGSFFDQLRLVLNNFQDAQWLGEKSPLAAPYFLGTALSGKEDADKALGRGRVLQQLIQDAVDTLWDGPLPQTQDELETAVQLARQEHGNKGNHYHFFLIELRYLRRFFRSRAYPSADSEQAIRDYLGVGRGPYFNHIKTARQTLGEALINLVQPTFRLEQPPQHGGKLIGREKIITYLVHKLQSNQTVAITGMGGVGKTSLAAAIAEEWPLSAVFWFTFRPALNDQLINLLFALGYFLHQHGASGLWLQLVANQGNIENPYLVLEQVRGDLLSLNPKPLLCFDELDHLVADADKSTQVQQQLLSFIESLHGLAPIILMGQHINLLADVHHTLEGLTPAQAKLLLTQNEVLHTEDEVTRLHAYTSANTRMIWLCVAQCQNGRSLTEVLDNLPETAVFQMLFARFWRSLSPDERQFLQRLAVFRNPAPEDAFNQATAVLDNLLARHILQHDQRGAISLIPIIHDLIYEDRQRLPADKRDQAHLAAAAIRAERGEYTSAAFHFARAGEAAAAVQVWYPYRQQEIKRGLSLTALAIFEQLSLRRLPEPEVQALALLRAELYQLAGDSEQGLAELDGVQWEDDGETAVQAYLLRGAFLNALGYPEKALDKLEDGLATIARLMDKLVRYRQQRTLIHLKQWQMQDAIQEARLAQYTAEHLQGLIQEQQGNYDEAYIAYQKALALARSIGYDQGKAQTNRDLAKVLRRQSRLDEARHHLQDALDFYESIGDRLSWEKARNTLGGIHFQAGEFEQVIAIGEESLPFFERAKMPYYASITTANLAEAYYETGDLAKAEFFAHKTLSLEETHTHPYALYTLGLIKRAQKAYAGAEKQLTAAQETAANNSDTYMEAYALRLLGEVLADQGKRDMAVDSLNQALVKFKQLNIGPEIDATINLLDRLA